MEEASWEMARKLLRSERVRRRLSQDEAGAMVGRSRKWVSELEGGKSDPGVEGVLALARALGIAVRFEPAEDPE